MADTKISEATVLTGTGLLSSPVARAGSTTAYRRVDNLSASADPGVGDDSADGFHIGSLWMRSDNGDMWRAVDVSAGAAVWVRLAPGIGLWNAPWYAGADAGIAPMGTTTSSVVLTNQRFYMVPFAVHEKRAVTSLSINVTVREASKGIRCGIYTAHPTTRNPYNLVVDAGVVDLDTSTGSLNRNTKTISTTLYPGMYYAAFLPDVAGTAAITMMTTAAVPLLGFNLSSGGTASAVCALFRGSVTYQAFSNYADESAQTYSLMSSNFPFFTLR